MVFDFKKEYKALYVPKNKPVIITVPKMNYIIIRGHGNPNEDGGAYQQAIRILYAVAYTLRMSYTMGYKIEGYYEYVVPPLEGFWLCNTPIDKASFNWISAIRLPEFVSKADFDWAIRTTTEKRKIDCSLVEYLTIDEGLCVQIMHHGSFDNEPVSISLMTDYIKKNSCEYDFNPSIYRLHHEIYLSDKRRVSVDRMRTVIRHPVRRV